MNVSDLKLIDAHCHLNFGAYREDAADVAERAAEARVGMVAVGSQSTTSQRAVDYAERYEHVWAVIGLHPLHLFEQEVDESEEGGELAHFRSRAETFGPDFYRQLIERSPKVVGIGECGLDYYHVPPHVESAAFRTRQVETFRQQVDFAFEHGLALMIHNRNAADGSSDVHADLRQVLEESQQDKRLPRFDVHCFAGTTEDARAYLDMGGFISFAGNVTFKPRPIGPGTEETLHDLVKYVPLDRLIVETDSPYLTPVPHRGKRNEPSYVRLVADKIAELKDVDPAEVYARTLANTRQLYSI